jgi:hypothetical protein
MNQKDPQCLFKSARNLLVSIPQQVGIDTQQSEIPVIVLVSIPQQVGIDTQQSRIPALRQHYTATHTAQLVTLLTYIPLLKVTNLKRYM